ncbi:hypothetical protein FQN54_004455 [Arachnomyces sp. PD_36]|nr:hypothetical protein FQN54_004455 [Arachnomyces sp. PD_36]
MARPIDSPGPAHVAFEQWANSCGITINGVGAARFHGQGLGIAALRKIDVGEVLVKVPLQAMLTPECIPDAFRAKFGDDISIHGLMAAYLCCGDYEDVSKYAAWWAVWPTMEDFEESMPIMWPEHLKEQMHRETPCTRTITEYPPPAGPSARKSIGRGPSDPTEYEGPLVRQEKNFEKCFQAVKSVFPGTDWKQYCYYWLIVNTRSFYHKPAGANTPKDRNDAIALCPYADYFNHTDVGNCVVSFNQDGYIVQAAKSYEPGEEVYVCYGKHNSDFLQVEYGFVPDKNQWDAINLDTVVLDDLNDDLQVELLREQYFGNYQLTPSPSDSDFKSEPCYRTEVAACIKYMSNKNWLSFVRGHSSAPFDCLKTDEVIRLWIGEYKKGAEMIIGQVVMEYGIGVGVGMKRKRVGEVEGEEDVRVLTVLRRWRQVVELCEGGLRYLKI